MSKLFVPYYIALEAKNRGFNEPCLRFFSEADPKTKLVMSLSEDGDTNTRLNGIILDYVACPTYGQLADWFRREKCIEITVHTQSTVNEIIGFEYQLYSPMSWPVFRHTIQANSWDYWEVWDEAFAKAFLQIK